MSYFFSLFLYIFQYKFEYTWPQISDKSKHATCGKHECAHNVFCICVQIIFICINCYIKSHIVYTRRDPAAMMILTRRKNGPQGLVGSITHLANTTQWRISSFLNIFFNFSTRNLWYFSLQLFNIDHLASIKKSIHTNFYFIHFFYIKKSFISTWWHNIIQEKFFRLFYKCHLS